MNKYILPITLSILCISMVSCKSKEEKAAELIKNELAKSLYDFDSYQPVETIVSEAKMTEYNDTSCLNMAGAMVYGLKELQKMNEESEQYLSDMKIWAFSSSAYSRTKLAEYKQKIEANLEKTKAYSRQLKVLADQVDKRIAKLDTTQVVGWEVKHTFRCKTRGGTPDIGHYRYIVDNDFKNVLWREDLDDEDFSKLKEALEYVKSGNWKE